MKPDIRSGFFLVLALMVASCSPSTNLVKDQTLKEKAASEATAIVERAEATAIVLRAQTAATALMRDASGPTSMTTQPTASVDILTTSTAPLRPVVTGSPPAGDVLPSPLPAVTVTTLEDAEAAEVEVLNVGFAAEGQYIIVNYTADPNVAQTFWPGVVSIVDEASGTVYNEVPVVPVIGPLIARPHDRGQPGYVMLVNAPVPLQPGTLVTVVLGEFKQEHVVIQ